MSKTVKLIFTLSLLLNIGFIAFGVTRAGAPWLHPHKPMRFDEMVQQLPEEKREAVQDMLAQMHHERKADFHKVKALRAEVKDILNAPVFDEAAFREKSAAIDAVFGHAKNRMVEHMARIAATLSQEERAHMAEMMLRRGAGAPPPRESAKPMPPRPMHP